MDVLFECFGSNNYRFYYLKMKKLFFLLLIVFSSCSGEESEKKEEMCCQHSLESIKENIKKSFEEALTASRESNVSQRQMDILIAQYEKAMADPCAYFEGVLNDAGATCDGVH